MLGQLGASLGKRLLLLIVSLMLCVGPMGGALGQIPGIPGNPPGGGGISVPPGGGGGGIQLICKPPPDRCLTKEAREAWAREHNCKWPEQVCEGKIKPGDDKVGAAGEEDGFWGSLWDGIKSGLTYGYEFVKGLVMGLKEQITDLWHMVTNPGEIIDGLIALGKSFYNDPKGTMAALGEMLGQEAVDTFTRATQCGAYDLGKVIGSYVSPVFALKLATRLTKYSGKLSDAAKALRREYGCASFGAGTLVLTADGYAPIETIAVGQQVRSRNENSFGDRAQQVTDVFGRIAPSYRLLATESEELRVTDEHPFWLQGKGWTEAHKLVPGDVIASEQGDTEVVANQAVAEPLRVYNFSVANTPNYFVGAGQVWAHNAKPCSINVLVKNWQKLTPKEKGFRAEWEIAKDLQAKGYKPVGNTMTFQGNPQTAYASWNGQTGIDAIYEKDGKYYIIESKATGGKKSSDPDDCKLGLCKVVSGDLQMSRAWIDGRLEKMVPNKAERDKIIAQLDSGDAKLIYAQRDAQGSSYHHISQPDKKKPPVVTKEKWEP